MSDHAIPELPALPVALLRDGSSIEDQFLDELRMRRARLDQWLRLLVAEASREPGRRQPPRSARKNRGALRK